jgi:hypothetical protein
MYGKPLCQYLESVLSGAGIDVWFYCAEDWGGWLAAERGTFQMSLCIYSDTASGE